MVWRNETIRRNKQLINSFRIVLWRYTETLNNLILGYTLSYHKIIKYEKHSY